MRLTFVCVSIAILLWPTSRGSTKEGAPVFVNSLPCNGSDTVLAYTLSATSATPGRGHNLNIVLAENIDCSGVFTSIADATLDHEFGHVFQLDHVSSGSVPPLGIWPNIFTGVANLIVPATNLMCGPNNTSDELALGYLKICSICRQFRYLLDYQQNLALSWARLLRK
jgi:hypothetical protein